MLKPILEKFLSSGEVEVLKIGDVDFALKKITTKQADYLNVYYEYFISNPEEFFPFINAIVIEADKEKLKRFLYPDGVPDIVRLQSVIHAICIQSLSLRPISLDYTFSNTVEELLENATIMDRFIGQLILFGYKKSEIDEFSNNKIIRLALEEMYIRDKAECLVFIADFVRTVKSDLFPLSNKVMGKVEKRANDLVFKNPENKTKFLNIFYEILGNDNRKTYSSNAPKVKFKSNEEIQKEIAEKRMFNNLPK